MNTNLIKKIVALARADENIRAVILEGSYSSHVPVDELSDYDINIYTHDYDQYLNNDQWLSQIGDVLLYQKEQIEFYEEFIPSRLVLFRDGERVDFSFWHPTLLADIVRGIKTYESYKNGYEILIDKDNLACQLKPATGTGFTIPPPTHDEFLQTIYDFWFEAYCVAKYLSRKNLWYAKLIENRFIKDYLYRMALWNHQALNEWKPNPLLHIEGKHFEQWASPELVKAISDCFSVYDEAETWKSLFAMIGVFNQLAHQTSNLLQIEYPQQVEQEINQYLTHIKERSGR